MSGTSILSPDGQYLQYRAILSTTDSRSTPELQRVDLAYSLAADTTPPSVTGRSPQPGATGVSLDANVTVTFSEAMDPTGIDGSTIRLREVGGSGDVLATVSYA